MKKFISILGIATALIFFCSSCSKCTTCTKSGGSITRICEKDFSSNTSYGLTVDYYEHNGYTCN